MTNTNTANQKIKSILLKLRNATGVDYNTLFKRYFMDEFMSLVADSPYKDDFVFKGGIILSKMFGLDIRQTEDIDMMHLGDNDTVVDKIKEIIKSPSKNGVIFKLKKSKKIIEGRPNENGDVGRMVEIEYQLNNMKNVFSIDIGPSVSFPIPPQDYHYNSISGTDNNFYLKVDALEKVIAEKLSAITTLDRKVTRYKDFFDIYFILSHDNMFKFDNETIYQSFKYACQNYAPEGKTNTFNLELTKSSLLTSINNNELIAGVDEYINKTGLDISAHEVIERIVNLVDDMQKIENDIKQKQKIIRTITRRPF